MDKNRSSISIIFINRFFYPDHSATSQLLSDLAFYLAESNLKITVITSRQKYDDADAYLPKKETINGVRIIRLNTSKFGRANLVGRSFDYFSFYLHALFFLLRLTKKNDIVISKTDPPLISIIVFFVTKLIRSKQINWLQDLFPEVAVALEVPGVKYVNSALRWFRNLSLRTAEYNVVLGQRMRDRLISEGVSLEKIKIIHNWADGSSISPVNKSCNSLVAEWELNDKFVVGYSGNMGRAHDFQAILDAAELLKGNHNIIFLFIGGGAQRELIENERNKRQLNNIIFKPYQPREQLQNSLSVADVHLISLIPSLEGLIVPSKFYGIAAAGRTTIYIGDEAGEIPSILRKNNCGYTVKIADAESLVDKINTLFTQPELNIQMGRRARGLFVREFDKPIALQKWEEIIDIS